MHTSESFEIQKINTEQILQLIEQIDASVKVDDLGTTLAQNIVRLHLHLKAYGQHLEQMFKSELNRLFVSLRKVCCRDTGQLGSLCLLRIMELVELRAMGWRSCLAHTQYYLSRNERYTNSKLVKADISEAVDDVTITPLETQPSFDATLSVIDEQKSPICGTFDSSSATASRSLLSASREYLYYSSMKPQLPLTSPPPLCVVYPPSLIPLPLNVPSIQNSNNKSSHSHLTPPLSSSTPSTLTAASHGGYFIIPASGSCWSATQLMSAAATAMPASTFLPPLSSPSPSQPLLIHCGGNLSSMFSLSLQNTFPPPTQILLGGDASLESLQSPRAMNNIRSGGGVSKSSLQFREDMMIRNSDSGKVMGVKGRRVALVEALSGTVISFQKVDVKCRERILTISGLSAAAISDAKRLIQETISRNMSPIRPKTNNCQSILNDGNNNSTYSCDNSTKNVSSRNPIESRISNNSVFNANACGEMILLRRNDGGKLRFSDPSVLQAAQTTLTEYFNQAVETKNDVERALPIAACWKSVTLNGMKCRRSTSFNDRLGRDIANGIITPLTLRKTSQWWLRRRTFSAPNLCDGLDAIESLRSKLVVCAEAKHRQRKRYTRAELFTIGANGAGAKKRSFLENLVARTDLSETLKEILKTDPE